MALRPRDSQKSKFWRWLNGGMLRDFPNIRSMSVHEHDIVHTFEAECRRIGIPPPDFRVRKNSKTKFSYRLNELTYYPTSMTVTYLSVALSWHRMYQSGCTEPYHGPQFCLWFAETVHHITKIPLDDIKESMKRANLKFAGATPKKVSARMMKRYQLAEQRVSQIETSIRLAREEFEEFLKPVIEEHKKISTEMVELKQKLGL